MASSKFPCCETYDKYCIPRMRTQGTLSFGPDQVARRTLQNAADDFALDFSQALAPSLVEVREGILIEAELMQDGGVDIAQVMGILHRAETDLVGGSGDRSAADTAACHPHG